MTLIKINPSHLEDTLWGLFVDLFDWDPENQGDMTCIKVLSEYEVEPMDLVLLSSEELCKIYLRAEKICSNVSRRLSSNVRSLQFYLKNLQEKGFFSFERDFNFSSINRSELRNFWMDPHDLSKISKGEDTRPIPPPEFSAKVFDFESSPPPPLNSDDNLVIHPKLDLPSPSSDSITSNKSLPVTDDESPISCSNKDDDSFKDLRENCLHSESNLFPFSTSNHNSEDINSNTLTTSRGTSSSISSEDSSIHGESTVKSFQE